MRTPLLVFASLLVFSPGDALTEESGAGETAWTSPQNLGRLAPIYPQPHLDADQSGWVEISIVVSANGETLDPVVVDAVGGRAFELAALDAARGFRYEPATRAGVAVEGSPDVFAITFTIGNLGIDPRRSFLRRYNSDMGMLSQGMLDDTPRSLDRVRTATSNLGELRLTNMVLAEQARQRDDPHAELQYLQRADISTLRYLEDETYESALTQLIDVQLRLKRYAEAFESWGRLQALDSRSNTDELSLRIDIARIHTDSNFPVEVPAEIRHRDGCEDCGGPWAYTPTYREFAIASIDGTIDSIDVRCEAHRLSAANVESTTWQLDPNWGQCLVLVFGESGTTFTVVEAGDPAETSPVSLDQ